MKLRNKINKTVSNKIEINVGESLGGPIWDVIDDSLDTNSVWQYMWAFVRKSTEDAGWDFINLKVREYDFSK